MYSAYSFVLIPSFIDNAVGVVSPVGELAPRSYTASKEKGSYSNADIAPSAKLVTFRSTEADENTNNTTLIQMPVVYRNPLLMISNWITEECIAGNFTADRTQMLQYINAEFGTVFDVLDMGAIVLAGQNQYIPSSITLKHIAAGNTQDNYLKLWFADETFRTEYTFFEIEVLSPTDVVDALTNDYTTVFPLLEAITVPGQLAKADTLFSKYPTTHLIGKNWRWYDFDDATKNMDAPYVYAIWGFAGNSDDAIREATKDYLLANSSFDATRWGVHHPDLFVPTEFYIIPTWHNIAIPFQTILSGIYSATVKYADIPAIAAATMPGFTPAWIAQSVTVSGTAFKSLNFLACGHPDNRLAEKTFDKQWPRYTSLSTTHIDFDRMGDDTENFILLLNRMLVAAESMTAFSDLPQGMTRVVRDDMIYLSTTYEEVQYLVLSKQSYPEI